MMNQPGPYIGPRSYRKEEKDLFFGRNQEAQELVSLVLTERLVVFYAQSGAGKSSLINAKLIPELEANNFFALPVGRVGVQLVSSDALLNARNIYVYNLLEYINSFTQGSKPTLTPGMTISDYLIAYSAEDIPSATDEPEDYEVQPQLLVIDQFEELFTTYPDAWQQREDFFKQLREAMKADPKLWVVLALREDYQAALEPYAYLMPGKMQARFYMQRLNKTGAEEAIQKPALQFKRQYTPEAIDQLVKELLRISSGSEATGQFVEPIQLQVYCLQLWEKSGLQGKDTITEQDLANVGSVEEALGNYYAQVVNEVSTKTGVGEFKLRQWIDENLISSNERSFVYEGKTETEGLSNEALRLLDQARLLHSVARENRTGYELAHDRLIPAVQQNNEKWIQTNLDAVQQQAVRWHQQGEPESLLLQGKALKEFHAWVEEHPQELIGIEDNFEKESVKTDAVIRKGKNRRTIIVGSIAAAIIISVLLFFLNAAYQLNIQQGQLNGEQAALLVNQGKAKATSEFLNTQQAAQIAEQSKIIDTQAAQATEAAAFAVTSTLFAQDQREKAAAAAVIALTAMANEDIALAEKQVAESRLLAAEGKAHLATNVDLGILLSLASYRVDPITWEARSALLASLMTGLGQNVVPYELNIPPGMVTVKAVDISPDGKMVAWSGSQGLVVLWDVAGKNTRVLKDPQQITIYSQAFSPVDPNLLVTGNEKSELIFWDLSTGEIRARVPDPGIKTEGEMQFLGTMRKISFSGDGRYLAVIGQGSFIQIWDAEQMRLVDYHLGQAKSYYDLDWSPNSRYLAAAGDDKRFYLFDPIGGQILDSEDNPGGNVPIFNVEWSPDSKQCAFGGNVDGPLARVYFYDVSRQSVLKDFMEYKGKYIYSLAYNEPEGKFLAGAGYKEPVLLWDTRDRQVFANISRYDSYQFELSFVKGWLAFTNSSAINVYQLKDQEPLTASLPPFDGKPIAMGVGPTGDLWLASQVGGELVLHNLSNGEPFQMGSEVPGNLELVKLYFSPAGPGLVAFIEPGTILNWDSPLKQPVILDLNGIPPKITALAVSRDGRKLALSYCSSPTSNQVTGGCASQVLVWDLSEPNIGQPMFNTTGEIRELEFSWDGSFLFCANREGKVDVIDLDTGSPQLILLKAASLASSPDGRTLAVGSEDGSLIFWDLQSSQLLGSPITSSNIAIENIAYAPDGKTLYAAYADSQMVSLDVDFGSWFDRLCKIVGHDITADEWRLFLPDRPYIPLCENALAATSTPKP